MKAAELRNLSTEELTSKIETLKKDLYKLRVSGQTSRVEKPGEFKRIKREVARILTILKEQKDDSSKKK